MADTIFALSSGRPPAAISVIRISGAIAHQVGERLAGSVPDARTAAVRDLRHPGSGELLDRVLILRFDAPASSTGEDTIELHCHGGRAVVDALLHALTGLDGLRQAKPGEFTRRAFENDKIDLTEAEGLADLIEAETESQRKAALRLADGGLSRQIEDWRSRLLDLSAQAERAIDYDEDDVALDPALVRACVHFAADLRRWLERPRIEPLRDGLQIVVAGPPNSGKSSLINAIAGEERVIVTDVPGTTRDHVEVPLSLGGLPIRLTDTAGLRKTNDKVEAIGVERAARLVDQADVLVWLGDPRAAPNHSRLVKVRSKADLPSRAPAADDVIVVSSVTHQGIPVLLNQVEQLARSVLPAEGGIALNRRQATHLAEAAAAIEAALNGSDIVVLAESLRLARGAFDRLTGRAGVEDVLDALFGRFCLGK